MNKSIYEVKDNCCEPWRDVGSSWIIDMPQGWYNLFVELEDNIKQILYRHQLQVEDFTIDQLKEKFGEIRLYFHLEKDAADAYSEIFDEVERVSRLSGTICCKCGGKAEYYSRSWVRFYCLPCAKQRARQQELPFAELYAKIADPTQKKDNFRNTWETMN